MKTLIHFLISTIAILITAYILPGVYIGSVATAFVLAVILGAINLFVRPILVLLTLPITIMTLGVFMLVINGILIMLASYIVPQFAVDNFWWAILFGTVLALVNSVFQIFNRE